MKEVEEEERRREKKRKRKRRQKRHRGRDSFRYPRQAEREPRRGSIKNKKMRLARCCPMDMHETCKCIPCPCSVY